MYRLFSRTGALLILLLAVLVFHTPAVSAHSVITDKSGLQGVVMYIAPKDDPIAGEASEIYLEVSDPALSANTYTASLNIRLGDTKQTLTMEGRDNVYFVDYVFPREGSYKLLFTLQPQNDFRLSNYTFTTSVEVYRAIGKETSVNSSPIIVFFLGLSVVLCVAVAVLFIVRLPRIKKYIKNHETKG